MSLSDVPISDLAPSKPKPGRKPKKQRAPRIVKKREFAIQALVDPKATPHHWVDSFHGDEVSDTASGLAWIKANGLANDRYRVIIICAEKTKRMQQTAVLE